MINQQCIDDNAKEIYGYINNHPEIKYLYENDATVHTYFQMSIKGGTTLMQCLTYLVGALANEKKAWYDMALKATQLTPQTILVTEKQLKGFKK